VHHQAPQQCDTWITFGGVDLFWVPWAANCLRPLSDEKATIPHFDGVDKSRPKAGMSGLVRGLNLLVRFFDSVF
jgi:hypothetical protein